MASTSERLAEWICSVRHDDIPERVLKKTRYQTLSMLASMHAGMDTEAGRSVARAAGKWASDGPCSVMPSGEKLPMAEAVLVNTAYSLALDYDDYLYMGHTGHSAMVGSWAIAEAEGLSTRDVLTAQVVANEIGGRVGASTVLGPQNGQAWSFIHAAEGAALAAKLYGLTPEQTAHALSIAMYQPTFTLWPGFMGPGSKVLTAAGPTVTGIQAALLAREGLTGAREIFEHPRKGFWAAFAYAPLPHMLTGLGKAWVSDTLAFKGYPGCAYIDTTLDALFDVLGQFQKTHGRPLSPDEVAHVAVHANLMTVEMDNISSEHVSESEPLSPINVNFSIPFNVAIAIVAGKHDGATLSQAFLDEHDATIRRLAGLTTLEHDWAMSLEVARAFDGVLGSSGAAQALRGKDLVEVLRGYRRQLGGKKKNPVGIGKLLGEQRALIGDIGRLLSSRRRPSGAPDLDGVDFSRFAMTFPAEVRLETHDGQRFWARQDVPFGAPGQRDYYETVERKYAREAGVHSLSAKVDDAIRRIQSFEEQSLPDVIRTVMV